MQEEATKKKNAVSDFNAELEKVVDEKRLHWEDTLRAMYPKLTGDPQRMVDVQAEALSYRQMICEEIAYWGKQLSNENKKLKKLRKDRFLYYSTGTLPEGVQRPPHFVDSPMVNLRTGKGEKDLVIAGDLCEQERTADLYANLIDYFTECRKNVDHCLYGVRNRIELLKVLTM